MSLGLRVLHEDELPAYKDATMRGYIEDIAERGGVPRHLAEAKAQRDFDLLWPDGKPAEGNTIYAVEEAETRERVGSLWLAERDSQGRQVLWIYDIQIDERFRGRGFGRATMGLVEEQARERGLDRVELNVFGGNEVARTLYRSVGYEESAVWMGKDLT